VPSAPNTVNRTFSNAPVGGRLETGNTGWSDRNAENGAGAHPSAEPDRPTEPILKSADLEKGMDVGETGMHFALVIGGAGKSHAICPRVARGLGPLSTVG